ARAGPPGRRRARGRRRAGARGREGAGGSLNRVDDAQARAFVALGRPLRRLSRALGRGPALESVLEHDEEVVPVGGRVGRDLAVDVAGEDELDQRVREGLHLEERPLADRVWDLLGPRLADQVRDAAVRDHDLDGRNPAAVDAWKEPLADDPAQDDCVSWPTSRWLTMQLSSGWRISIGSSIVITCCCRVRLTCPTMAARVMVFPDPVAPVTRTRPRASFASRSTPAGRFSSAKVGT